MRRFLIAVVLFLVATFATNTFAQDCGKTQVSLEFMVEKMSSQDASFIAGRALVALTVDIPLGEYPYIIFVRPMVGIAATTTIVDQVKRRTIAFGGAVGRKHPFIVNEWDGEFAFGFYRLPIGINGWEYTPYVEMRNTLNFHGTVTSVGAQSGWGSKSGLFSRVIVRIGISL